MKYADIKNNDIVDCGSGIAVSFWTQGCPHHCHGCHNPQTWDFNGGKEDSVENIIDYIIKAIKANNINRNFSILGGEPFCPENIEDVLRIIKAIKSEYPNIKIYVWTGYTYEDLISKKLATYFLEIRNYIDYLIDGLYEEDKRNITLFLRGSSNQRVIDIKRTEEEGKVISIESI